MGANKAYYEIKRETSKYNKYMKWHVIYYYDDTKNVLSSMYFRTEKEAKYDVDHSIWKGKEGFPIGNRISYTDYFPLPN